MEKNVYAQMYMDQLKKTLNDLVAELEFIGEGSWVECNIDENILLKGIYKSRLTWYLLRDKIFEIEEKSYSKKELKKVEKEVLGYYFSGEKQLRKEYKKEFALNEQFSFHKEDHLKILDEVKGMILYNMIITY